MDDRIVEKNYKAMLEALYTFAVRSKQIGDNILTSADNCRRALEREDTAIEKIYAHAARSQKAYNEIAAEALDIAKRMAKEFHDAELERMVWDEED